MQECHSSPDQDAQTPRKKPEAAATAAAVAESEKRAGRAEKGPAETKKEKLRH